MSFFSDTIAAIATPAGVGGLAVVRISGPQAIGIVGDAWKGVSLRDAGSHTVHLGEYRDVDGKTLDQCVATLFRGPNSFTGEDVVELSLHGSRWIQNAVITDLIRRGVRTAEPGEFTRRAFINGRIDLAQAEGIADLISASSRAAHSIAMKQTKGTFSSRIASLRESLVELASLLELELDFSEEDVEFADRSKLLSLAKELKSTVDRLAGSYSTGSAIKEGVSVVIAGIPNAGKSTLLNALLEDDKAIVSDIAGTTRDIIEDTREIDGVLFRIIDTAGLRDSDDTIEKIGIDRAKSRVASAAIVIWMFDVTADFDSQYSEMKAALAETSADTRVIIVINKADSPVARHAFEPSAIRTSPLLPEPLNSNGSASSDDNPMVGSVNSDELIDNDEKPMVGSVNSMEFVKTIEKKLVEAAQTDTDIEADTIVTNARHYEALLRSSESLSRTIDSLQSGLPVDLIAQDIREATHHLGTITGAITSDTLLHTIFSRFCIGK